MTSSRRFLPLILFSLILVACLWNESETSKPASQPSTAPNQESTKVVESKSRELRSPAPRATSAPSQNFSTSDRGQLRNFVLSLDEAVERLPSGKDRVVRLDPPATLETLSTRLSSLTKQNPILPVCYPEGKPHTVAYRRIVTRDLTVRYDESKPAAGLPAGLVLKERPAYAPGFAVVSADDPFAAIAALPSLRTSPGVLDAELQLAAQRQKKALPNDTLISDQWHLKASGGAAAGSDLNVETVWAYGGSGGYRGSGISIGIVDDGLQTNHPDLAADTVNDKDWNGNDNDPSPQSGDDHGTACAGVAGAVGNNNLGVAGVAPEATLVGMRLIAAAATDSQEAEALSHLPDIIEIKSNSWGPNDDGSTLEGPGSLTLASLANAAATGRNGLGSIQVWAAGNGLGANDNSNYDGYANNIHTIAVTATDSTGEQSFYAEPGANIVVAAPSDGSSLGITTTDRTGNNGYANGDYTDDFGGTSSATPAVAGVVALMLEANPGLGWRDVQEILIASASMIDPTDSDWINNGAGFQFNHKYGAGLVDAAAAVALAETWTNLASAMTDSVSETGLGLAIPDNNSAGITRSLVLGGPNLRCEHVTVNLSINHSYRGDLEITLTSPSGTVSRLAEEHSDPGSNYSNWTFSSVRHWGENSNGTWLLKVSDKANGDTGTLSSVTLTAHGASGVPINPGPVVSIDSPMDGDSFSPGATVSVSISASDFNDDGSPGTVASVELFDNGSSLGIDTSAPFFFSFNPALGSHDLTVEAIDGEGEPSTAGGVSFTVIDQAPTITAAELTPASQAFSDEDITVTGITANDPEGSSLTYTYTWESSSDGITWSSTGITGATLNADPTRAGLLWRSQVTANDGTNNSATFTTAATNSLIRPPSSVEAGENFSYLSGLVLRGSESTLSRDAIINEFSQGVSGTSEWVEILILRETSLRNWVLADSNSPSPLSFANVPAWDDIPAGTLLVVYNGASRDSLLPADDSDPAGGQMIVASNDSALFTGTWPAYGNGGDAVILRDSTNTFVAGFSYGSNSSVTPFLGAISSGKSAYYTGDTDTGADLATSWKITDSTTARFTRGTKIPATLPFTYGGSWSSLPTGITGTTTTYSSSLGGDTNPGSARFDSDGEILTVEFDVAAGTVSYQLRGNTGGGPNTFGTFIVEESSDNISYSALRTITDKSTADTAYTENPSSSARFIRFRYEDKISGNIQLDKLEITAGDGGGPDNLGLAISPASFSEGDGATAALGTVTIPAALASGLTVTLTSSDPTAATVPTSVTIIASATSASFNIAAINDADSDGTQASTITASAANYTDALFVVTVTDDEPSLEGVTPAAGNNPANIVFVADLQSGAFNSPALFRLGTGITLPDGLSLDAETGVLSGVISPTASAGDYTIVIERFNTFAEVVSQSFILEVIISGGYTTWITGQNVSAIGEMDDPDKDGLPNVVEYYLDGNAGQLISSQAPILALGNGDMTLTFWRLKSATDVTGAVEWSDSLLPGSWSNIGVTSQVIDDQPTREQIEATIPAGAGKRFVRLRVSY